MLPADDTDPISSLVVSTITALTLGTAFGLLALGVDLFWIAFPLGFGVVLPTALTVVGLRHAISTSGNNKSSQFETVQDELQQRYVRGELSEEEFEQQLERLLENNRTEITSSNKD